MRQLATALLTSTIFAGFAGTALAADLSQPMYTKAPPAVAPSYNWTGFYLGLNVGGSWGHQDNSLVTTAGLVGFTNSNHIDGVIGGGQIGYNWQINQVVLGVEADIQGSGQKGDGTFFIPAGGALLVIPSQTFAYTDKLNWFGTVRGRVGYAFDRWLPYVTGGWAYGHGDISGTVTSGGTTTGFSGSRNYSGWTVGGGVEWAFMNNWSAKLEYLFIDFGDGPTLSATPALNIVSGRLTDNIVRAGVNYKF